MYRSFFQEDASITNCSNPVSFGRLSYLRRDCLWAVLSRRSYSCVIHGVASAGLGVSFAVASGFVKLGDGMYFVDALTLDPGCPGAPYSAHPEHDDCIPQGVAVALFVLTSALLCCMFVSNSIDVLCFADVLLIEGCGLIISDTPPSYLSMRS